MFDDHLPGDTSRCVGGVVVCGDLGCLLRRCVLVSSSHDSEYLAILLASFGCVEKRG